LLPAVTEVADGVFVNTRVASPAAATTSVAVALLLEALGSLIAELTEAVSVKVVPSAVPTGTVTMKVIVPVAVGASDGAVQLYGTVDVQTNPPVPASEENVVPVGSVSGTVTVVAVLGPLLVTTCVKVIVPPASTGNGVATLVMARSDEVATWVVTVALLLPLFGSPVVEATEAVSVIVVPAATVEFTVTVNVIVAMAPEDIVVVSVHL
jgi:hypothetical protein